jgi:diguanylate cyclase (GGDEF)-like protein/PAS domain S-box-containing protein
MPFELGRLLLAQAQTSEEVIRLWGEAFPFSFVLDGSLTIISSGPLLRKIYPGVSVRSQLTQCFTSPQFTQTNVTTLQLRAQAGQLLLLYCASREALPPLRGQWLILSGDHLLFLGWPWVTSFGQLAPLGISLVDIPPHNPLAEILLLLQTNRSAMDDARDLAMTLKQSSEALEQVNLQLKQQVEERSRAEAAMAVARQLAEVTLESIGDGVIVIDLDSMVTSFNAAAARLTEIHPEQAMGQSLQALFAGRFDCDDLHACVMARAVRCCAPSPVSAGNASLKLVNGKVRELEYTISRIHDPQKKIVGSVLVLRDVSQAQALTRELAHQAYHDALTGLPNRLMLRDRLQQALQRAARRNEQLAVLFVDLDRFKAVNDTLGHRIGDALLCAVADRLRQALRQSDTVAREGGDEFVIILEHIRNAHHGAAVAHKLLKAMDAGYQIDGQYWGEFFSG